MRIFLLLLLSLAFLSTVLLSNPSTQTTTTDEEEWYWFDQDSVRHTRAELDTILAHHTIWQTKIRKYLEKGRITTESFIQTRGGILPVITDSSMLELLNDSLRAVLKHLDLTGADLSNANLIWAVLEYSNLTGAKLSKANLTSAHLKQVNLSWAWLDNSDLTLVDLRNADLTDASLFHANLTDSWLSEVNLTKADISYADLTGAYLYRTDLTQANLFGTDLTGARLLNTNLSYARFELANMYRVVFEPDSLPRPQDIAFARNLSKMTYDDNPSSLIEMRNKLDQAGYRQQAKEVNAAYRRCSDSWYEKVLFDWTCEYGVAYFRPFAFLAAGLVIFGALYFNLSKVYRGGSDKYLIASKRGFRKEQDKGDRNWVEVKKYWKTLGIAILFSLQRALRIGFREFSPDSWLRMMLPPEFELKPRGWVRFVSSIQSILSVAFILLAIFSYFSRPFEF